MRFRRTFSLAAVLGTGLSAVLLSTFPASAGTASFVNVAGDNFARTVTAGFGQATSGGAWTLAGNPTASIKSGSATFANVAATKSAEAFLAGTSAGDVLVSDVLTLPTFTASTTAYHAVEARRQTDGSAYLGKIVVLGNGQVLIAFSRRTGHTETALGTPKVVAVRASATQAIRVDFSVAGTSTVALKIRAYAYGSATPDWQSTTTDSGAAVITAPGAVGLWDYVGSASTATTFVDRGFLAQSPTVTNGASAGGGTGSTSGSSTSVATPPATWSQPTSSSSAPTSSGSSSSSSSTVAAPPTTWAAPSTSAPVSAPSDVATPPVTSSAAPATSTAAPAGSSVPVSTPAAPSTSSDPSTSSPAPVTSSPAPSTSSSDPSTSSPVPSTSSPAPSTSSQAPSTSSPAPSSSAPTQPTQPTQPARGTLPVGQAQYTVPANAIFVSPSGSDSSDGSTGYPLRTVTAAVAKAAAGQTIVLRAGIYHEGVNIAKSVTIENYPGEAAWLDGSQVVSGWTASGSTWTVPWTVQFDHSSSFARGDTAAPGPNGWNFVNPAAPMAAWPDQVFVDGVAQTQVASNPAAGQFAVDYTNKNLTLGSDPAGHTVAATTINRALTVSAASVTIRGLGVRRYATSLPDIGTVYLGGANDVLQNVEVDDSATQAVSADAANITVDHVTVVNPGMVGVHSNHADNLIVENSRVLGANSELFNTSPSAGGMKLTRSNNISVINNEVTGGHNVSGIWLDENVIGLTVVGNEVNNNGSAASDIMIELSGGGTTGGIVANNLLGAADKNLYISDSANLKVFNNSFSNAGHGEIWAWMDDRRINPTASASVRPSAANPWLLQNIQISNNEFAYNGTNPGAQLYVADTRTGLAASTMNVTVDGNAFHQNTGSSERMVVWGQANGSTLGYNNPAQFNTALGKNWNNILVAGTPSISQMKAADATATNGLPLPADVAAAIGQATGTTHIGSF